MKKLNAVTLKKWDSIYINLTPSDLKNFELNHAGFTTLYVNLSDERLKTCTFASKYKDYLTKTEIW